MSGPWQAPRRVFAEPERGSQAAPRRGRATLVPNVLLHQCEAAAAGWRDRVSLCAISESPLRFGARSRIHGKPALCRAPLLARSRLVAWRRLRYARDGYPHGRASVPLSPRESTEGDQPDERDDEPDPEAPDNHQDDPDDDDDPADSYPADGS